MGRFLDSLSRQPTPWLQKMQLDAQPSRPLLQRVFSKLPKRQPGERYAYGFAQHAFLARQPQNPPLGEMELWQHPLISNVCWRERPPLAGLAAPAPSLLGGMSSQRVPGAVASLLVLGLCLAYLINHEELTPAAEPPAEQTVAATTDTAPATTGVSEQEPEPVAQAAEPETPTVAEALDENDSGAVAQTADAEPMPTDDAQAPQTTAAGTAPQAGTGNTQSTEPVAASTAVSSDTIASEAETEATAAQPVAEATQTEQNAVAEQAGDEDKPENAPSTEQVATTASASDEAPKADKTAGVKAEETTTRVEDTTPAEPVYFNKQRSLAILTEARYLYLSGEGPLAVERLGLALSSGHIHPDHVPAFARMETDIQSLLASFETAQAVGDAKSAQDFLALEEEVFPGKVSAYEAQLVTAEEAGAEASAEPVEETADETSYKGLQAPEPEAGETRQGGQERPH